MANLFAQAFNKALARQSARIRGETAPRRRTRSRSKQRARELGTWQEARRRLEESKARIKEPPEIVDETRPVMDQQPPGAGSRSLVRDAEFRRRIDEDPAFGAWINRVGSAAGAPLLPGRTLTESRLAYLCGLFGVEDPLELYEFVTGFDDFGYTEFQSAYALDGKNRGNEREGAYTLNEAISMMMAQESVMRDYAVYGDYGITFEVYEG